MNMLDIEMLRRANQSYLSRGMVPIKPRVQKIRGEWMAMLWHFPDRPDRRAGYYFHDQRSAVQFVFSLRAL